MELTKDQESALTTLLDWYYSDKKSSYITLGGLAGTGKTTIISLFREKLPMNVNVAFVAYTGKAASVMKNKLTKEIGKLKPSDYCGTIHSLIYEPVVDEKNEIIDWRKCKLTGYDLIIVDECSMVSRDIFNDLISYNIPILFVGDHGQLPPINADNFNLMDNPDIKLETMHRFGDESELLKISMEARINGKIKFGNYNNQVIKVDPRNSIIRDFIKSCNDFSDSMILCGFNKTRVKMNQKIRKLIGRIDDDPIVGDRVVCLRNNKHAYDCPIYNGMTGTINSLKNYNRCYDVKINLDCESKIYKGEISKNTFMKEKQTFDTNEFIYKKDLQLYRKIKNVGDYYSINNVVKEKNTKVYLDVFDFAYAMTVHKAQGSEYNKVVLIEEGRSIWGKDSDLWKRWLYTAVTRARNQLLIISML